MRKKKKNLQYANKFTPYFFILPNCLIFIIFIVVPLIFGLYYSFFRWKGIGEMRFIGLENYISIFKDFPNNEFTEIMLNTFTFVILTVPLIFIFALMLANLLIKPIKAKGFFRASIYWPAMVSMILVGVTWKWILGEDFGILNYILSLLGIEPVKWLTSPNGAMFSITLATLWNRVGFYMVIFMSGLQSIPESYYEACDIDGAKAVQKFRYITLPLLKPTSFLVLILSLIDTFKAYGIVYSLTGGGPNGSTKFIVQYIYEFGFEKQRVGYASALSVILFIILGGLTAIQFKASKGGEVL